MACRLPDASASPTALGRTAAASRPAGPDPMEGTDMTTTMTLAEGTARSLSIRHDHDSAYLSRSGAGGQRMCRTVHPAP